MAAALESPFTDRLALAHLEAVLVQVTGGLDLSIADTAAAVEWLRQQVRPGCEVVVGAGWDPALAGAAQVMLLGAAKASQEPAMPALIPWPEEARTAGPWRRTGPKLTVLQEVG